MSNIRALQKYILKASLAGRKGAPEISNYAEMLGRKNIFERIAGAQKGSKDWRMDDYTAHILNNAEDAANEASNALRSKIQSGNVDRLLFEDVQKKYKKLFEE